MAVSHLERVRQILTETKGILSNKDVAEIVLEETNLDPGQAFVQEQRKKLKLPQAKMGKKSKEVYEIIASYKTKGKSSKVNGEVKVAKKPLPPPEEPFERDEDEGVEEQEELEEVKAEYAPTNKPESAQPLPMEELEMAFATTPALSQLEKDIIKEYTLTKLVLVWENGSWQEPQVERIVMAKGKVKFKR